MAINALNVWKGAGLISFNFEYIIAKFLFKFFSTDFDFEFGHIFDIQIENNTHNRVNKVLNKMANICPTFL